MAKGTCSVEGCGKSHYGKGWCYAHYTRWKRHGDPVAGAMGRCCLPIARFNAKYVVDDDGCWIWTASTQGDGYGSFSENRKTWMAHRWSYAHFLGPIPDGLQICHRCDVPSCVNPMHLFLGTQADNIADMWRKGRSGLVTDQTRKLSRELEAEIRLNYTGRRGEQKELAERYGVSRATMNRIVHAPS